MWGLYLNCNGRVFFRLGQKKVSLNILKIRITKHSSSLRPTERDDVQPPINQRNMFAADFEVCPREGDVRLESRWRSMFSSYRRTERSQIVERVMPVVRQNSVRL